MKSEGRTIKHEQSFSHASGEAAPTHTTWKRGQPAELEPAVVPSSERGEVVQEHHEGDISHLKAAAPPRDKQVPTYHLAPTNSSKLSSEFN